eukprot:scaffold5990_cov36-Phaeocystis_antarctica.AAC.1
MCEHRPSTSPPDSRAPTLLRQFLQVLERVLATTSEATDPLGASCSGSAWLGVRARLSGLVARVRVRVRARSSGRGR